jgi:hypothetical protein
MVQLLQVAGAVQVVALEVCDKMLLTVSHLASCQLLVLLLL